MSSSCIFNFFIFVYSLHHFCVKISIPEVQTLRLTPILPQLICQYVICHHCHLSFMSIYDIWQMPNGSCENGNMGVKWRVWTSGIQILSQKLYYIFQKYRNKGKMKNQFLFYWLCMDHTQLRFHRPFNHPQSCFFGTP